jgi:hypothetical protein
MCHRPTPPPSPAQWDSSGTRGLQERGVLIGPKTALLTSYVFTAILSLMKHVINFKGRYLHKESFCSTILLNNVSFKGENEA